MCARARGNFVRTYAILCVPMQTSTRNKCVQNMCKEFTQFAHTQCSHMYIYLTFIINIWKRTRVMQHTQIQFQSFAHTLIVVASCYTMNRSRRIQLKSYMKLHFAHYSHSSIRYYNYVCVVVMYGILSYGCFFFQFIVQTSDGSYGIFFSWNFYNKIIHILCELIT